MSDDKVVNFPGTNGPEKTPEERRVSVDDVLAAAAGKYDDVVLIGISSGRAQCISTLPLKLAIYELSRAIHRIHERPENLA